MCKRWKWGLNKKNRRSKSPSGFIMRLMQACVQFVGRLPIHFYYQQTANWTDNQDDAKNPVELAV